MVVLAGQFEEWLGPPTAVSLGVGAFLVAWAAFVAWAATRDSQGLTREIALLNSVWVVVSVVFAVSGVVDLTAPGVTFVLAQAVAVAGFVLLQTRSARSVAMA
jgi:hypothetical protein